MKATDGHTTPKLPVAAATSAAASSSDPSPANKANDWGEIPPLTDDTAAAIKGIVDAVEHRTMLKLIEMQQKARVDDKAAVPDLAERLASVEFVLSDLTLDLFLAIKATAEDGSDLDDRERATALTAVNVMLKRINETVERAVEDLSELGRKARSLVRLVDKLDPASELEPAEAQP